MKKLEAELRRNANSSMYPFHMPGHKRQGDEMHRIDITEIDGFDNLHDPEDLILGEMQEAEEFYGTKRTFFSVNGSTCALLSAISAAIPKGGSLLCERGCHISVYHTAYLRDLKLRYVEECISVNEKGEPSFLNPAERVDGILLTSPSYEGVVKNIRAWADLAHEREIPLIVDEAHGAHFSMHPYFPRTAIKLGADLVVQSLHKTLPAMTQTALLHNVTGRVSNEKLMRFLDIYETSSPSYVLMASITSCLHQVMDGNQDLFERYVDALKRLRADLAKLKHLHLLGGEESVIQTDEEFAPYKQGQNIDPGKICIFTDRTTMTGVELYDRLRLVYHLQPEMKTPSYVILMTSPYDTAEGFQRLTEALFEIDGELETCPMAEMHEDAEMVSLPPVRMSISEAMEQPSESITLGEAAGHISSEYVIVYPPDSPLIVPGEVYTEEMIQRIRALRAKGLTLTGIREDRVEVLPFDAE